EYLAMCLSVRGQERDLPEWFAHHYHHFGVRRFYVQDDGTTPPLSSATHDWGIPREAITFTYFPRSWMRPWRSQQHHAYSECHRLHGRKHTWMAHLDADEFLELTTSTESDAFTKVLQEYEADDRVGAVALSWRTHTSAGLLARPASARKAFDRCIDDNSSPSNPRPDASGHIKSIVRTNHFRFMAVHYFPTAWGTYTVGENWDRVDSTFRKPMTVERFSVHHYICKSREEFEEKMRRGNGMDEPKTESIWVAIESANTVHCDSMARYNP
ncbi:hypothetical protein HKX48_000192, partial [Thoreauomyces humboldtii]